MNKIVRRITQSLAVKLILTNGCIVSLLITLLTIYLYYSGRNQLEERFGWSLEHIALTASVGINGDDHAQVRQKGDENNPSFRRIHNYLKQVKEKNQLTDETIYTFQVRADNQPNKLKFGVMLQPEPFVGDIYTVPAIVQPHIKSILAGKSAHTPLYDDEHGEWISGYAPIYNSQQQVSGILAVDHKANEFLIALQTQIQNVIIVSILFILTGIGLVYWQTRRIVQPIKQLNTAAKQISQEIFTFKLEHKRRDELGELSDSFSKMAQAIRERLMTLKYISPHTRKAISLALQAKRSTQAVNSVQGENINMVILFSDIRGYTPYVQHHSPAKIISTLNQIAGAQAEIIQKHNGFVDKFAGDQITATFEGDDKILRAISCAIEIVQKIDQLSKIEDIRHPDGQYLSIGIGMSVGDVIVGSIGSSERKDVTIVGNEINLAARLCKGAKSREILISPGIHREIVENMNKTDNHSGYSLANVHVALKGRYRVRGFDHSIVVYTIQSNAKNSPDPP